MKDPSSTSKRRRKDAASVAPSNVAAEPTGTESKPKVSSKNINSASAVSSSTNGFVSGGGGCGSKGEEIATPWACRRCTFDNEATSVVCEVCSTARLAFTEERPNRRFHTSK
mmetsp:Transcript_14620/g.24793  ORF Transcript_14620/g.24793 Transcript_14620/m.24793 type:complete len:112 (-) Transcript_14620:209-544(-)